MGSIIVYSKAQTDTRKSDDMCFVGLGPIWIVSTWQNDEHSALVSTTNEDLETINRN